MVDYDDVDTLVEFNIHAEELLSLPATKAILQGNHQIEITNDKIVVKVPNIPDEYFRGFVILLRLFMRKSEPISFHKINELYSRLPLSQQKKYMLNKFLSDLYSYLDSKVALEHSEFRSEGRVDKTINVRFAPELTNRDVFWTILYGRWIHLHRARQIKQWQYDHSWAFVQIAFQTTLRKITDTVKNIMTLNADVLNELLST